MAKAPADLQPDPGQPPQGHILGAVMVLHDVTEQRAFERVRSEFVLRASHELRTPVTGMHMAFGLLRERVSFPRAREPTCWKPSAKRCSA
jgi:NtrC-family two-component system sensor histidine kinase KinB